ncbi:MULTISPECIES: DEAD/DEAH box helicase [Cobetia]|uniref:DEAD/DEAH box helicase n=1 Tax=Cobetia TaxID=204286 RepID=UPI00098557E6|nr:MULTISPECIES: DEAD/DEAH box helicase [Cobetia]POR08681.1 DEAD/DEAH box helicase [Cobetia sp. MM1IDA2H-1]
MGFRSISSTSTVPSSPDKLFRDLSRRKLPDVLPHQAAIMQAYAELPQDKSDVALQLPTGSGKSLVGLLIAEWRRIKYQEKVLFLCPTKQLAYQVANQAEEKYGLSVEVFTGSQHEFSPASKTNFQQVKRIGIATYSALFNTNSYFKDCDILILDDAHTSENYIASQWSLLIDRTTEKSSSTLDIICSIIEPHINTLDATRLRGKWDDISDRSWVDMLPISTMLDIQDELIEALDANVQGTSLYFPWSYLRDNLDACQIFLSTQGILIRPLLPPTFSHLPFCSPKQRIFMSATLGAGGDLERLTGRKNIHRLNPPDGWDAQGVGRRFFIFPEMSLDDSETEAFKRKLVEKTTRSLFLTPSDKKASTISEKLEEIPSLEIFWPQEIEETKTPFTSSSHAAVIAANRYDGVDFASDECRLLFIEGLPKAMNSQERFLMSRMGANILFNERVLTRVVQAIGRCTRSLEDYSAVVITGEDLPDYIADVKRRKYLHPELQAEIKFGVEQSSDRTAEEMLELYQIFQANGQEWAQANQMIIEERSKSHRSGLPAIEELDSAVQHEIEYQTAIWRKNYQQAVESAENVLGFLGDSELRGYRALWHYLAGKAAYVAMNNCDNSLEKKIRLHFSAAYKAAPELSWLASFTRANNPEEEGIATTDIATKDQVERIGLKLKSLGTIHNRKFAQLESDILNGLKKHETFEQAQKSLGELLGFISHKIEKEGSPDPWWVSLDHGIVFEDYVGADPDGSVHVEKARQAASHPSWIKQNHPEFSNVEITPVIVSSVEKIREAATPHTTEVSFWSEDTFIEWAKHATYVVRSLRTTFTEPGDLVWTANAAELLEEEGLTMKSIISAMQGHMINDTLTVV